MDNMNPIFWTPTNTIGIAATVDTTFEDQSVKVNFYWSAVELAAEPQTNDQLTTQIRKCLTEHPLNDPKGKNVFHIQSVSGQFGQIKDPGWVPPAQRY